MKIVVPKERRADESRVAATPESVKKFIALGFGVTVESGAGAGANILDQDYADAGAAVAEIAGISMKRPEENVVKKRPDWFYGLLLAILCLPMGVAQGESNWPRWRGPSQDGHYNGPAAPTQWNADSVVWKAPMKGRGQSSPIIWAERIFLTTADDATETMSLLCLDRASGKKLWAYEAGGSFVASPAVADGRLVIASEECVVYCFGKKE
ncbi:MAG: PQQ-binding-like beta-propeller repeat protein [Proteobacteria bacterium]|nr:PQQ-binding-like beta-propeller repeat protein [Pseudomonadota bacterium]